MHLDLPGEHRRAVCPLDVCVQSTRHRGLWCFAFALDELQLNREPAGAQNRNNEQSVGTRNHAGYDRL